jgi:hypothetical protein
MNKYFFAGLKICQKTGITANDFEFLQCLLFSYPSGIIDASLIEIAEKTEIGSNVIVYTRMRSLKVAGLVTTKKKRKRSVIYYINVELIKEVVNE